MYIAFWIIEPEKLIVRSAGNPLAVGSTEAKGKMDRKEIAKSYFARVTAGDLDAVNDTAHGGLRRPRLATKGPPAGPGGGTRLRRRDASSRTIPT